MNYEQVKQAVKDYLEVDETVFNNNISWFVESVENHIYQEVQLPALRKNSLGTLTIGNRYLLVPSDFLSVFSVAVIEPGSGEYEHLLYKDVNLVREIYPTPSVTGKPKVFGLFDTSAFILGPTPDKAYQVELHYFFKPTSISVASTSWIGDNFPSVLVYGAVAEAYRFLKGDEAMQKQYDTKYQESLNLLRKLGEGMAREDAYSTSPIKTNVILGE